MKYSITKGNYSWQKTCYQTLFNYDQGLTKRMVQIRGISGKEAMKKSYFGINTVLRLQLSTMGKNAFIQFVSPFTKTTNEHLVRTVYCKCNKRN